MTATINPSKYSEVSGIRHSYVSTRRVLSSPVGGEHSICFGDKLFARLMMGGKTILEFMVNKVNDLSELIGELRRYCRGTRGLAKLYLRNMSRGWSLERPLMLYSDQSRSNSAMPSRRIEDDGYTSRGYTFSGKGRQLSFQW